MNMMKSQIHFIRRSEDDEQCIKRKKQELISACEVIREGIVNYYYADDEEFPSEEDFKKFQKQRCVVRLLERWKLSQDHLTYCKRSTLIFGRTDG